MWKARDIYDPLDEYKRLKIQIFFLGILQKAQVFDLQK